MASSATSDADLAAVAIIATLTKVRSIEGAQSPGRTKNAEADEYNPFFISYQGKTKHNIL